MTAYVAALYRHPIKGFTPEPVPAAQLTPGQPFPHDRIWAVENGPSGFDPEAPAFVPKQKFTVLASIPEVARARTAYDPETTHLTARADGRRGYAGRLSDAGERQGFADWVAELIGEHARGPLQVLAAPAEHRFTDHPRGHVSIVNLASVRELEGKTGREIDPLRFRANVYVEGWPAWSENEWEGKRLMLGWARVQVFKPIVRCAAPGVNPTTAEPDMDIVKALFDHYGHMNCGIYVHVTEGGLLSNGDAVTAPESQ